MTQSFGKAESRVFFCEQKCPSHQTFLQMAAYASMGLLIYTPCSMMAPLEKQAPSVVKAKSIQGLV